MKDSLFLFNIPQSLFVSTIQQNKRLTLRVYPRIVVNVIYLDKKGKLSKHKNGAETIAEMMGLSSPSQSV